MTRLFSEVLPLWSLSQASERILFTICLKHTLVDIPVFLRSNPYTSPENHFPAKVNCTHLLTQKSFLSSLEFQVKQKPQLGLLARSKTAVNLYPSFHLCDYQIIFRWFWFHLARVEVLSALAVIFNFSSYNIYAATSSYFYFWSPLTHHLNWVWR